MALVKLGALTQDVRGSLNGSVFSRNRGGAYVRSKVSPIQPVSEWSSAVRTVFKAVAMRWATVLEAAQRAGWTAFASVHPFINVFGDSIQLSGIAMYEAVNVRVRLCGGDWIDDAPSSFVVADPGGAVVTSTIVDGAFTALSVVAGRALEYNEGLYLWITPGRPGGVKIQKTDFRLMNTAESGTFTSGEELKEFANGRFTGTPWGAGQQWGMMVAILNTVTGAISSAVSVLFLV